MSIKELKKRLNKYDVFTSISIEEIEMELKKMNATIKEKKHIFLQLRKICLKTISKTDKTITTDLSWEKNQYHLRNGANFIDYGAPEPSEYVTSNNPEYEILKDKEKKINLVLNELENL